MLMSRLPSHAAAPEQGTLLPRVSTLLGRDRPCTVRAQPGRRGTCPVKKLITLRAKTSNPQTLEIWERPSSAVHPSASPGTQTHTPRLRGAHTHERSPAHAPSLQPLCVPLARTPILCSQVLELRPSNAPSCAHFSFG